MTTTTPALPATEIVFDPETRDFALYLGGELVGFARTYQEGEVEIGTIVYERGRRGRLADAAEVEAELRATPSDPDALRVVDDALIGEAVVVDQLGRRLAQVGDRSEAEALADVAEALREAARPAAPADFPEAPEFIVEASGREYRLVAMRPDGSAEYRAGRSRTTLTLSDFAVRLLAEGMGVTIETLVDHRTGRTRLFNYRPAAA